MSRDDIASHTALASATALYAVYLDTLNSSYHPHKTYWTVVGGTALTGAGVALRFLLSVPDATPRRVARWCWLQVFYHYITSGGIIGIWQLIRYVRLRREREEYRRYGAVRTWSTRGRRTG